MRVAVIALVAGCAFHPGAGTREPDDAPADVATPRDAPADVGIDGPPPLCEVADASLVLCLEFNEVGLAGAANAIDGSGKHHDAALSNIGVTTRTVPATSQAITLTSSTDITLPMHSDFDLQHFTLSAWVKRNALAEMGVFDTGKQYTISLFNADGSVECAVSHQTTTSGFANGSPTASGEWDLVACTNDGAQLCSYSFRNGSKTPTVKCLAYTQSIDTGIGLGTTVGEWAGGGSHFTGALDQVRVYNRALSASQLCVQGGLSGC